MILTSRWSIGKGVGDWLIIDWSVSNSKVWCRWLIFDQSIDWSLIFIDWSDRIPYLPLHRPAPTDRHWLVIATVWPRNGQRARPCLKIRNFRLFGFGFSTRTCFNVSVVVFQSELQNLDGVEIGLRRPLGAHRHALASSRVRKLTIQARFEVRIRIRI